MADIKISELPVATVVNDADVLVINQGTTTKQATRTLVNGNTVVSLSGGGTGLLPNTATSGAVVLSGTLLPASGGTGQSSYTDGQLLIGNTTGNTLAKSTLTAGSNVTITNGPGTITIASTAAATPTNVQVFTSSGTWTKPVGAKSVHVVVIAGGGGGGSGRASASGTAAGGGGGGGGSARTFTTIDAAFLGATETVTVGAGGLGAIARSVGQDGLTGGNGTPSSFGLWASASQGGGGGAGTSTTGGGTGAQGSRGLFAGAAGGLASATFGIGGNGNASSACPSGGAGGGVISAGTASTGGTGGFQFLYNGSAQNATPVNTAGGSVPANLPYGGAGGGGGNANASAAANAGGNGGDYGAGGGGGGGSQGFTSGAGGNGGNGIVVVTTYF